MAADLTDQLWTGKRVGDDCACSCSYQHSIGRLPTQALSIKLRLCIVRKLFAPSEKEARFPVDQDEHLDTIVKRLSIFVKPL